MDIGAKDKVFIEGYAKALQDIQFELTGSNGCGKSYDPMTVELTTNTIHSYAFDLKDGGRHHPFSDYTDMQELLKCMLNETTNTIKEDLKD